MLRLNEMVESLKKFYEYMGSDEELMYHIRINAEWNEESFLKMQQLVREVIKKIKMIIPSTLSNIL